MNAVAMDLLRFQILIGSFAHRNKCIATAFIATSLGCHLGNRSTPSKRCLAKEEPDSRFRRGTSARFFRLALACFVVFLSFTFQASFFLGAIDAAAF